MKRGNLVVCHIYLMSFDTRPLIHTCTVITSVRQDEFAGQSQWSDRVLTNQSCETSWQANNKTYIHIVNKQTAPGFSLKAY